MEQQSGTREAGDGPAGAERVADDGPACKPEPGDVQAALARVRRELEAAARFAEFALASDASAIDELLEAACRAACQGSGAGGSKILLPEPGGSARIAAGVGWRPGTVGMRVPAGGRSVPGPALVHARPTLVADLPTDRRFDAPEPLTSHGIVSVANVPIVAGDAVCGVIELDDVRGMRFGADELAFLRCLAGTVAQAMGRADAQRMADVEGRVGRMHRARSEFLAMLAHELRGPMAPVRNALAVLERSATDPIRARAALGVMRRQLGHLARLLGDLLEVSRVDRGHIALRLETLPLLAALSDAIETVQPMIDARGQRLSLAMPEPWMRIRADTVRLTQVVANLLHNAVKFSPEGGRITLRAGARGDALEIVVHDEGRGIEAERLPHIFGLFEQGEAVPLARPDGGLGLGLPLARRLVEMHGGTLTAESPGPGQGATFTIRLPGARAISAAAR